MESPCEAGLGRREQPVQRALIVARRVVAGGKPTSSRRPPPRRAWAVICAPWASAIALTTASPSPSPALMTWLVDLFERLEQPSEFVGGNRSARVLDRDDRSSRLDAGGDCDPARSASLWRIAFARRLSRRRSIKTGSPVVGAGSSAHGRGMPLQIGGLQELGDDRSEVDDLAGSRVRPRFG